MRIIAGKYRGRKLKSLPGADTRPTSDRLRETLFNILAPRIGGARFLDLFAGTGAVGIEALSRGAEQVTFVDQSRTMCALIKANLETIQVDEKACEIVTAEASDFLRAFLKKTVQPYDILYFDPPYASDYEEVLSLVGEHAEKLLKPAALIIVEHHKKKDLPAKAGDLKRYRVLKQGDSVLSFYQPVTNI